MTERKKCVGHVIEFYLCVKEDVIESTLKWYDEMDLLLIKVLKTKYTEYTLNVSEN